MEYKLGQRLLRNTGVYYLRSSQYITEIIVANNEEYYRLGNMAVFFLAEELDEQYLIVEEY